MTTQTQPHISPDRQTRLLDAVTRMARASSSSVDSDELMRWAAEMICAGLGYDYAGVFLLDETGQWAMLKAAFCCGQPVVDPNGYKLAVGGNSTVGLVTLQQEARLVSNTDAEEVSFARTPFLPEAGSELTLPLAVGKQVFGALSIQSLKTEAFSEGESAALQALADQLALAVRQTKMQRQQAKLALRTERRARLLEAANEVGQKVSSILDLDELLPNTVDIICAAYGFYYAGVFLIDKHGEWAELAAGYGEAGVQMLAKGHKLAVGGHSMVGVATQLGEARIALDVGEERVHFRNPFLPHTRSEMALPLKVGERVLGAVTVQSTEERAFSSDDILTLQTMADHLAVAIHNARLVKILELANQDLLRAKTYEALTASTTKTIHWIGNKALPITTAVNRLQADLQSATPDRQSMQEDLDMIAESARQIIAVKETLLGQAREQQPRPAMLSDVAHAAALLAELPSEKLVLDTDPAAPLALADTTQLTRALENLIRNSMEAGASQVRVSITPASSGAQVSLTIADDGQGIAPEVMENMWAAFVTTKGPEHNGLGLPAALHIVSQLHGHITADSHPGQGASFVVLLPSAEAAWGQAPELADGARKVVLIDDQDDWAHLASQVLSAAGREVAFVAPAQADPALTEADLILLDEMLAGISTQAALAALIEAGAIGKVVLLSPALKVESTAGYLKAGVKDVVLKPYTAAELVDLLKA